MLKDGKVIESQFQRQRNKRLLCSAFLQSLKYNFFKLSLTFLVLLSGIFLWQKCGDATYFPIRHIKITGDLIHVERDSLQQTIRPFLDKGFLRFDSRQLKGKLLQEAWIDTVVIKRFWPDTLLVNFTTKKPVALIGNNNLLDEQGHIFNAGQINSSAWDLPRFVGPLGQQKYLLQTYQAIYPLIKELGLKIKLLKLVNQQFWYLQLSNGLTLYLSRIGPDIQLKRFVDVYADVIENKVAMIDYADLRYAHGMAIKYKRV